MKILVSGTGNMAHRHLAIVQDFFPDAKVYSYSKSSKSLANVTMLSREELGQYRFTFAIIANAAPFHCEIAHLLKGIPILLEKPVSDELVEAEKLLNLECSKKISVGYHLHHSISFLKVKNILHSRSLGEIISVQAKVAHRLTEWRKITPYENSVSASKKLGGGVLLELSHDIDYLRALFGMPKTVFCQTKNSKTLCIDPDVEDSAHCIFDFGNFLASLHLNMIESPPSRKCEIIGSKGRLEWDLRSDKIELYTYNQKKNYCFNLESNKQSIYHDQFRSFIARFHKGDKNALVVSLAEGVDTLRIVEACKISDHTGKKEVWNLSPFKSIVSKNS